MVDTTQVGHRGAQYSKEREVHHQPARLLSSDGQVVRLQARTDRGGQLWLPSRATGLHPGGPPGSLRVLCRVPGGRAVDHLDTRGR